MKHLGTISKDELERVTCAASLFHIPETQGYGVTLSVVNGKRSWVIVDNETQVMVIGDNADFSETYVLPIRLLHNGETQAHLGHESVELTVADGIGRFTGEQGFSEMKLLSQVETFNDLDVTNMTSAKIFGYHLGHLITMGTQTPTGVSDQDVSDLVPSISRIRFRRDALEVLSDFKEINAPASHMNIKAEVSGKTGEVAVNRRVLSSLTRLIGQDDVGVFKVTCDLENGEDVLFEGDDWRILVRQRPTGAAAYFPAIVKRLETDNIEFVVGDEGRICAKVDDQVVEIQLLDGRLPIIRCTIELLKNVERSLDLLQEIEQQNEGRVCTKFFIRDCSVVACLDLVAGQSPKLVTELRALVTDSKLLGECLAPYSVIGEKLDLLYQS